MNRVLRFHIIFYFFCALLTASSTTVYSQNTIAEDLLLSIKSDTITLDSVQIDTTSIALVEFSNLKEKYNSEEFIYEKNIEKSGWWNRFKEWFQDLFKITNTAQSSNTMDWVLNIFYVLIFIAVVYFIAKAIINKEGTWVFGKSSAKNIIPVLDLESDIHETDFKKLIKESEKESNYRLAIRYYYLWLIKSLTSAEIIEYDVEKTNSDYHNEIASKEMQAEFSYTSYLYNYIWYGEFDVDQEQFEKAKSAFKQFLNSIKA